MTIRELTPELNESLFKPENKIGFGKAKVAIPKLNELSLSSIDAYKAFVRPLIEVVFGVILVFFGASFAGSAFIQASHFSGILATIFYTYQAGTIMMITGCISVYDGIKQTGYV